MLLKLVAKLAKLANFVVVSIDVTRVLCCVFPVIYYCCVRLLCSIAFSVNHVPRGFREAMQHISMMTADKSKPSDMAAKTPSAPKGAADLAGR